MPLLHTIVTRMAVANLLPASPGARILEAARFLPPVPGSPRIVGDSDTQALTKLMKAYYDYGRLNWTWAQSSPPTAANGGLVKGACNAVACATFNLNFKWLAEQILQIGGMGNGEYTEQFLTMPGGHAIDAKWPGNVRTATAGFNQLRSAKFARHYWVTHGGINYDVCYNSTFAATNQIIWTRLLPASEQLRAKARLGMAELYRLEKPLPGGDHLILISAAGPHGWPLWQIVTVEQIKALRS